MHTQRIRHRFTAGLVALIALSLVAVPATASHSWGKYHWARASNPFTLQLGDNVDSNWDGHLATASSDWTTSSVLDTTIIAGTANNPVDCSPTSGKIEVCNADYGDNGWLGLAQIWVSRSHITQGTAKQNDYYFNQERYNTDAWRLMVICQEIAHAFGLDHQDETFNNPNLGSCMDYTNDPDGGPGGASETDPRNDHPNAHDFEQLETIYGHTDGTKGGGGPRANARAEQALGNNPSRWGQVVERDGQGRPSLYKKDLGNDRAVFTFVIWTQEERGRASQESSVAPASAGSGDTSAAAPVASADKDTAKGKRDGKAKGGKKGKGGNDKRRR